MKVKKKKLKKMSYIQKALLENEIEILYKLNGLYCPKLEELYEEDNI